MRRNPHDEARRAVEGARDAFIRAAAALTTWPIERDALPLALLEGAIGVMRVAEADRDGSALDRVTAALERQRAERLSDQDP